MDERIGLRYAFRIAVGIIMLILLLTVTVEAQEPTITLSETHINYGESLIVTTCASNAWVWVISYDIYGVGHGESIYVAGPTFECRTWEYPYAESVYHEPGIYTVFAGSVSKKFVICENICDNDSPITTATISGDIGNKDWYTSKVDVTLTAVDNEDGSGVAKTDYSFDEGATWSIYSEPFTISNKKTSKIRYKSIDNAGNVEEPKTQTIKIDKTPPLVTIQVPIEGSEYTLNQVVLADWSSEDLTSGLASLTGTKLNGEAIDTATVGVKTFSVNAEDNAGNKKTETKSYFVHYSYGGILQPINPDGSSIFKLGRTVPVKFQLTDINGNYISDAIANIYLKNINAGISGNEIELASSSSVTKRNQFRHDIDSNQYIYNLRTKDLSVGTWQIRIILDDGTSKYATISLRK